MTDRTRSAKPECISFLKEQMNKQKIVLCISDSDSDSDSVSRSRIRHSSVNVDAGSRCVCWVRTNVGQTRSSPNQIPLTP